MTMTTRMSKSKPSRFARRLLATVTFAALALAVSGWVAASPAAAQASHIERTVEGKVVNKADAPLPGAIVYLKDTHTLSIKTYICDDDGHFRFGQLSQSTDYEIWAESNGVKTATKGISSFDNRNSYNFTFTIK